MNTQQDVRPLHVMVPMDLHRRLKVMAAERDRSISAETRRALEARLEEFESEKPGAAA